MSTTPAPQTLDLANHPDPFGLLLQAHAHQKKPLPDNEQLLLELRTKTLAVLIPTRQVRFGRTGVDPSPLDWLHDVAPFMPQKQVIFIARGVEICRRAKWTDHDKVNELIRPLEVFLKLLLARIEDKLNAMSAPKGGPGTPRKRRRRKTDAAPRPLTPKQTEVVQIVGECKGNLAEAARRLGIDRATVEEYYEAANKKLGKQAVKHATRNLPTDKRGQDNLSSDDDQRR